MLASSLVHYLKLDIEEAMHQSSANERSRIYWYFQNQFTMLMSYSIFEKAKPHLETLDNKVYSLLEFVDPVFFRKFLKWSWDEKFIYGTFLAEVLNCVNPSLV